MHQEIREILAGHGRISVDPADVSDDANLYELGLTSHASVNVMLALEDRFDIEFPDESMTKSTFSSIDSIAKILSELAADPST